MEQGEGPIPLDPALSVPTAQMATELANEVYPTAPLEAISTIEGVEVNPVTAQSAPEQAPTQSSRGKGKTKYRVYTEDNLKLAVQAILENGLSLRKASLAYGVPKTTIAERVGNRRPAVSLPSTSAATAAAAAPIPKNDGASAPNSIATVSTPSKATQQSEDRTSPPSNTPSAQPLTTMATNSHIVLPVPTTRFTWTEEAMTQAITAVQSQGMTVADAARRFGVPPSHLNSRTRGREPKNLKGELSRMTLRQESLLAEWAGAQAALGLPATKDDVYDLAERVMQKHGDGTEKKLGKQWINHWQRRWPHVEVLDWRENEGPKGKRKRRKTEDEGELGSGSGDVGNVSNHGLSREQQDQGPEQAAVADGTEQNHHQQQEALRQPNEGGQVEADLLSVQDELQHQLEQEVVTTQAEMYA